MMSLLPAKRIRELPVHFFTDYADRLAAIKKAGADVIHLDVGSPDLPPPENVINTLSDAASRIASHGYQSHRWTSKYRYGWAAMYQKLFGVQLDPDNELLPLIGSKEGIFHLMLALIDPGDVVILPDPGYVTYLRGVQIAGGIPYFVKLLPENGFLPDLSSIPARVSKKAKLLWINYPNNPTGATIEGNFFRDVVEFAREFDILICHDAAYTQINYDNYKSPSLLAYDNDCENVLEFNTLSKSHNMAGWRMGVAAGNEAAIKALLTIKSNADSGHFLPMIEAATEAMEMPQSWITARNQIYQERRDLVYSALHNLGFEAQLPKAGLYIWWQLQAATDELDYSTRLLQETHVSVTPGSVFGNEGKGFVRISLTQPTPRITEALSRLTNWKANGN
jgi:LL-diaminopimelate aminotransferase